MQSSMCNARIRDIVFDTFGVRLFGACPMWACEFPFSQAHPGFSCYRSAAHFFRAWEGAFIFRRQGGSGGRRAVGGPVVACRYGLCCPFCSCPGEGQAAECRWAYPTLVRVVPVAAAKLLPAARMP
mmetsp:Transcript_11343/g.25198  ORF Transcript_11343/g.25198 Transcript_11343/m.25198 type:complete len:126 (+) Transcript_11343:717-1094(+)